MKNKFFLMIFAIGLGSVACSNQLTDTSNLYIPTPSDETATATIGELTQGRSLYIENCQNCHGLYTPESFSSSRWKSIMMQMAPKTRMSADEVSLVTKYVSKGK